MKKLTLLLALAGLSAGAYAQDSIPEANVQLNQYGQKVESLPVNASVQDGILVFQNKDAKYKMWFDVRLQSDAAVYFGEPDFCAPQIDGKDNTSHIGNGLSIRRARFAVKAQINEDWYAEFDTDWTSGIPEIKDAYNSLINDLNFKYHENSQTIYSCYYCNLLCILR